MKKCVDCVNFHWVDTFNKRYTVMCEMYGFIDKPKSSKCKMYVRKWWKFWRPK